MMVMESRWSDSTAAECVGRFPGCGEAVALRVYTSRLIGQEPDLVLQGGWNTSVKSVATDLFGAEGEVLHIQGSGWDLAAIEVSFVPILLMALGVVVLVSALRNMQR